MCSPAQLRQQSEELYAVIDEVLANSAPPVSSVSQISLCIKFYLLNVDSVAY